MSNYIFNFLPLLIACISIHPKKETTSIVKLTAYPWKLSSYTAVAYDLEEDKDPEVLNLYEQLSASEKNRLMKFSLDGDFLVLKSFDDNVLGFAFNADKGKKGKVKRKRNKATNLKDNFEVIESGSWNISKDENVLTTSADNGTLRNKAVIIKKLTADELVIEYKKLIYQKEYLFTQRFVHETSVDIGW